MLCESLKQRRRGVPQPNTAHTSQSSAEEGKARKAKIELEKEVAANMVRNSLMPPSLLLIEILPGKMVNVQMAKLLYLMIRQNK